MSIAGWSAGKLSATKLYQSVSTSGPTATVKPSSRKISTISSTTRVTGMLGADPAPAAGHGEVSPAASRRRRSASSAARRSAKAASNWRLEPVDSAP